MSSASNSSLSRSKQPCLWPRCVVLSFLFITVAALWAGCGNEKVTAIRDGATVVIGVVRDKETLEPLNKALVGVVYSGIPDSVLIDSAAFDLSVDVMEFLTETRENGFFRIYEFPNTCGAHYDCAITRISRLVAWRSGYRLWKYNVRRDTVSNNTPLNVSIYMKKIEN